MERRLGTVAVVDSFATRSGSANVRPAKAIVPTVRECDLPALYVPEIDRELPRLVMWWEGGMWWESGSQSSEEYGERARRGTAVLRRPFTDAERSALEARVWSLSCAVAPPQEAHRDALLEAISGMLGAFPMMQRYDDLTALAIAAAYLWSARERPHWAILKACGLVRSGSAGLNQAFCPREPEFNTIAGRCAEAYVNALRRTKQLLAGETEEVVKARRRPLPLRPEPSVPPAVKLKANAIVDLFAAADPAMAVAAVKQLIDEAVADAQAKEDGAHARRALADLEARRAWREDPPLG